MTDETQKELNKKLRQAAESGDAAQAQALLEKGADADYGGGLPLMWAAHMGHLAVVEVLLEAGADPAIKRADGDSIVKYASKHPDILELLTAPKRVKTPDEIIFRRPLGNRTLEEIFNFVSLERISLVRKSKHGAVEAITYTSFENVNDQSQLRQAFNEHVRRGGTADEALVFPNRLAKKQLKREG